MTEALDSISKREVRKATKAETNSDFPAYAVHDGRVYVPRVMGNFDSCVAEMTFMANNSAYRGYSFRFGPDIDIEKTESSDKVHFRKKTRAALWVSPPRNRNFEYFIIESLT